LEVTLSMNDFLRMEKINNESINEYALRLCEMVA
jgi:hypothetical protein